MGEMTIRVEDAVLAALERAGEKRGVEREALAADLIAISLQSSSDRAAVARSILAVQPFHDVDTTELIRQDRMADR